MSRDSLGGRRARLVLVATVAWFGFVLLVCGAVELHDVMYGM